MPDWISNNETLLWWMGAIGLAMLVISAIAIPIIVARLPVDYLVDTEAGRERFAGIHPALRIGMLILKNLLGWLLILAGLAMLLTPGQGLLAIFAGITLATFPGKRKLIRRLLSQGTIHRTANWIRQRCGVEPLRLPDQGTVDH